MNAFLCLPLPSCCRPGPISRLLVPALKLNASADPFVTPEQPRRFVDYYLAGTDPWWPYASPLYGNPAGLPPTLTQAGSDEVLRDDAMRMADRICAAGCRLNSKSGRACHMSGSVRPLVPEHGRRSNVSESS